MSSNRNTGTTLRSHFLGDMGRRVLGALVLLSLVPLVIVAYQGYHCARQAVVEGAERHLVSVLQSHRNFLEKWLEERLSDVDVLASLQSIRHECLLCSKVMPQDSLQEVCGCLDIVGLQSDAYETIVVFDEKWRIRAQSDQIQRSDRKVLSPGLKTALESVKEGAIGDTHLHEDGTISLHIGKRMFDENNRSVGAVVAELDLSKRLKPLLQNRSGLGSTGKVYVVSEDLKVLTGPCAAGKPSLVGRPVLPVISEMAENAEPGVREYRDLVGNKVLGTAIRVPSMQWILVAEKDVSETLGWLGRLRFRAAATATATMIAVLVVALWISKRLSKPLRQLAHIAHRIRQGHLEERLAGMEGSEAEEVRQAFNEMMDELERIQQRLIQTATLASIGELSSRIVHEMRNPLSSIKLNLQALQRKVADDAVHRELAGIAYEQVSRVEGMLTDLLHYGRPIELNKSTTTFKELSDNTPAVVEDTARKKDVRIKVEDRAGKRSFVVDRELICRALTNLCTNAIQAVDRGVEVVLRGRGDPGISGNILIEVLDTGPGLSPKQEEMAFKPFFTTKEGGTGLGLANVKKIADLHGGAVSAGNREVGGAVFGISLPQGSA